MLTALIIILVVLWILGYVPITGIAVPNIVLFSLNNNPITLWNVLMLLVIAWAIGLLPRPLQAVASILLLFWILSVLGVLAIAGLPNIIVLLIIVALVLSFFR